jgi:LuxR family maltose regulon positive regulatory protein
LDEEKIWYRYHHLFNDLLKIKMLQTPKQDKGLIQGLQQRAANWFSQHQYNDEAIQLYFQAGDHEKAAQVVEENTFTLYSAGRLHQLLSWMRLLPQELRSQRPKLNMYEAWSLAFAGRIPEAKIYLEKAEALIADGNFQKTELDELRAELQAIHSLISISSGNIPEAMKLLNLRENTFPKQSKFSRSVQFWSVGYALRIKGDLEGAEKYFRQALDLAYDLNNVYSIVSTAVDLGEILRQKGELAQAENTFRSALKRGYRSTVVPGYVGRLEAFLANLLLEKRELEEASSLIEKAIKHNQDWENPNHGAYALLIKARYMYTLKKFPLAAQALQEIHRWLKKGPLVATLRTSIELMWVNVWLAMGDFTNARQWLAERQPNLDATTEVINESTEVFLLAVAKVLLADGKKREALKIIKTVEAYARNMNRVAMLIQVLVMEALVNEDKNKAKEALREAILLGFSKGFRQVYLEYREALLPFLEELQDDEGVAALLAVIYQMKDDQKEDVLTEREQDILKWMATGLTNAEIGKRLYIAA